MSKIIEIPDCWKFVKVVSKDITKEPHNRVLCSWYGGYSGIDHWKLSSGNLTVIDHGEYLEVPQHSGTVYHLYKNRENMSGVMQNTYNFCNESNFNYELTVFDYQNC